MSDLVIRLRNAALNEDKNQYSMSRQMGILQNCPMSLMLEAASEITRLRAKLEIAEALQDSAYIAGAKAGWNAAQLDPDEANVKMASLTAYQGHLRHITTHTGDTDDKA